MSNLFTEVSIEQQAIVSGGLVGQSNSGSIFQKLNLAIGSRSISTKDGSTTDNLLLVDQTNNGSFGSVGYNLPAAVIPAFPSLPFN
ncbi:CTB family bacteriocin [Dolichospermum sp. UHCC 0259]|uniref:CTB family bacteriocin n=1 Tax=Dolichospermum sp. UHCC 0259 TaxID=2590010 RepID=UPI001445B42E|nr:CTB family bacteriocin [Dolichospermum sp. UHCC 0259]MTJ49591.1 hypothetical protein [Dolichospermum sp. UHCC 0259]